MHIHQQLPGLLQQPADGIGDVLLKKHQTLLNSAARVVTGTRKFDHITGTAQPPLALHPAPNTVQACHDRLQVLSRSCLIILGRQLYLGFYSSRSTSSALGQHI